MLDESELNLPERSAGVIVAYNSEDEVDSTYIPYGASSIVASDPSGKELTVSGASWFSGHLSKGDEDYLKFTFSDVACF
jgi:hypothetical protein